MKKLFSISVFFLLLTLAIFPQPWQLQTTNVPSNAIAAPFSPVNDNICWASWSTSWSGPEYLNGYCRTTDGGTSWMCDTIPETEGGLIWGIEALDANTAYIAVETWALGGMQGIYKTTDGGTTWQKHQTAYVNSPLGPGYIHFFDSSNGVAFGEVNPSISCVEIYTTTNGGTDWNLVPPANIPPSTAAQEFMQPVEIAIYGDCIWVPNVSSSGPRFYKSTDRGYNWTAIDLPGTNQDYVMFPAFQDANTGLRVVWTYTPSYAIIEKTTDGGTTWNTIPGPYAGCVPLNVCYVPGTQSAYVITGCTNVNGYANGSAYTLDGGNTWTTLDNGNYCYTIFESASVGWGTDWTTNNFYKYVGPPLPLPVELTSFTATANHKEAILKWTTATELNNLGFELQRRSTENEFVTIGFVKGEGTTTSKKEYSYIDKELDNGKYSYRLKQIDFSGMYNYSDVIEVDVRSVDEYALEQNYPNPFNPTTTIGFGVLEKSNVRITILNSIGEEVATILNEERESGYYQVEFNAVNLPSGVYFYRLKAGNFVQTKKMILMK
jgi:photosystem II stability/assembly factor-like uncharacterized protein